MKENIFKGIITVITSIFLYIINRLDLIFFIMVILMLFDLILGGLYAFLSKKFKSSIAIKKFIKKVVVYFIVVIMGFLFDLLMTDVIGNFNLDYKTNFIGLLCVAFFIYIESISIIKNIDRLGVPLPPIIMKFIDFLKEFVDKDLQGK